MTATFETIESRTLPWWWGLNFMTWAKGVIKLPNGQPLHYRNRPYLDEIAASPAPRLVLRAGRQVEKSTTIAILMPLYASQGRSSLYVSSRQEQVSAFSRDYLEQIIRNSPLLFNTLSRGVKKQDLGNVFNKRFATARIHLRAAYLDADSLRGLSVDTILFDEVQDLAEDALQVDEQCVSHAEAPRIIIAGTSKSAESLLQQEYERSTGKEYEISCGICQHAQVLDRNNITPQGIICVNCEAPLKGFGQWVSAFPGNTYADGYTISQLMNPSMCPTDLYTKLHTYTPAAFDNEVLGLPNGSMQQPITLDDIQNCTHSTTMTRSNSELKREYRRSVVAGIDWGGGGTGTSNTVVAVGIYLNHNFHVINMRNFREFDGDRDQLIREIAAYLRPFNPRLIGADEGGVGRFFNSLLRENISSQILNVLYCGGDNAVSTTTETIGNINGTPVRRYSVNKNVFVTQVIELFHRAQIFLPTKKQMQPFYDDFLAVQLLLGDDGRSKYSKPRHRSDDAFHALVYALIAGRVSHNAN